MKASWPWRGDILSLGAMQFKIGQTIRVTAAQTGRGTGLRWPLLALWLVAVLTIHVVSRWTIHPLSFKETVWAGAALFAIGMVFEIGRTILVPGGRGGWWEYVRLGMLFQVTNWVYDPFFTSQLMGGHDARWYGYVMVDALTPGAIRRLACFCRAECFHVQWSNASLPDRLVGSRMRLNVPPEPQPCV